MSPQLSAPAPLDSSHRLDGFFCGETALDDWLKRRALANQASRASRTFVVADPEGEVTAIYKAVARQLAVKVAAKAKDFSSKFPSIKVSKDT